MPPEQLPWDRKDIFKERKHERFSESVVVSSRWRETPHHGSSSSSSSRDFSRWGSAEFRSSSRPPGRHDKQGGGGGWHLFSEESGNGLFTAASRPNEKILDDESCRLSSGSLAGVDGMYKSRNFSRENSGGSFSQNDWKGGHSWPWENGASPNGSSDQRSVDDMLTYDSHPPHSDFVNAWDTHQLHFRYQHDDKLGSVSNGLGTGQRFERENSLGSIDWRRKPLKWTRSGSLSSRSSGFSHSSSSKSMGGVDSAQGKAEVQVQQHRNVVLTTLVQSSSGDAVVACATSAAPSEETSSRKRPRLNWGEGLAKYEKKKVEGLDDSSIKHEMVFCGSIEPLHSHISNLADKNPGVAGFSDCASPATPSSVACSSSPDVDDKPYVKAVNIDNNTINLSGSPSPLSQNHLEGGRDFNLENLELTPIANLSSSLKELLQSDDLGLVDFSFVGSYSMNKLLVWKGDISKALEMTEFQIDSLENELKSLISESRNSCPRPMAYSSLLGECQAKPCEDLVVASNLIPRPAPLQLVSFGDMIEEKVAGGLEEEHAQVRDEDVDSPGTVTSKFVELISSAKVAILSDPVNHGDSNVNLDASKSKNLEVTCSVYGSNDEKAEGLSASDGGDQLIASKSCAASPVGMSSHCDRQDILYDLILASNKDSANIASEVFNKLLPSDKCDIDISRTSNVSSWPNDPLIKEKFAMRKHFLRFKERVITLKFRAFQQLWKEDMRLLSIRKYRAKSQKRLDLSSLTPHGSYQKHRSSIRNHFSSPAGNLSLVPTTEIIKFTSKLLSDSQVKLYRNSLKMPSLILDKKEKIISRFLSSNGLVEDPCAVEKERAMINPWTTEEKEVFMDKLATFGKDFRKIASFLDHKTTADCIEFYYKNHKSDCFVKTKNKPEFAEQGKSCSTNNYMVTSGKRWNHETNVASLDMLGAASAIAANADDGSGNRQKYTARFLLGVNSDYRPPWGDDGIVERSVSLDIIGNERETVAADVLAGICGSLLSEAMSSCITSSFDPGESYQDWKCQKVGSSMRRPLTPEVTQNTDDETCSDESCGEMDPIDWTDEEKSIFIQAVSSYGKDFTMISTCVKTRSRDQCKVFFSKAQRCLGLDMICPRPGNEGMPVSDDANGGGSDDEDAYVMEIGSIICSEKSGSKMDKGMMLSDLNTNHFDCDPTETMNLQTDLTRSEENRRTGQIDCKDPELQDEHMVNDDLRAESKPELDFDGNSKMENGVDSMFFIVPAHKNAVFPPDSEVKEDEAIGVGTSLGEPVSTEEANDCGLSISSADGTIAVGQDSTERFITEPKRQQLASENNLNDKQDENRDANTSGSSKLNCSDIDLQTKRNASSFAADTNSPLEFRGSPKQEHKIALELNPLQESVVISPEQDSSNVYANSVTSSQYERTLNQDTTLTSDLEKISEKQCQKSASADDYNWYQYGHSVLGHTESCQILRRHPLPASTNKEMNGDISSKKLASLQSLSKVDRKLHSDRHLLQECFLHKCNSSKAQSSLVELPFLSQEKKTNQSRTHSWSLLDTERQCRNGDVKLFGQILTHPPSQQKQNTSGSPENEDEGVQHPKLSSKYFNLKFTGTNSLDANSVPAKFDWNNYLGIENVPIRSSGFWDGNRIQTGFSTLPDSAILLAKYPAAFGNYATSSYNIEQQALHSVVKSNERNLNGVLAFSTREMSSSNGVADYQLCRNREVTRVQPFTVDVKQRQDMLLSEMQRRNGFDAVSSMQQQTRGMVGINVMGRGGILIGGACAGVSDPVAAIRMHYAKTEQYSGQTASIIGEDKSWRGKGDIGR